MADAIGGGMKILIFKTCTVQIVGWFSGRLCDKPTVAISLGQVPYSLCQEHLDEVKRHPSCRIIEIKIQDEEAA